MYICFKQNNLIMKTAKNKNYVYYDYYNKISTHIINGYEVAMIDHNTGEFTTEIEMTEEEADGSYERMMIDAEETIKDKYDVKSEQSFFGYGY